MSTKYNPPVTILNLLSTHIDAQDGSQTQKQLIPSLTLFVNNRTRSRQTEDAISALISKSHGRVKRRAAATEAYNQAVKQHTALQVALKTARQTEPRQTEPRQTAIKQLNAHIIEAFNSKGEVVHNRGTAAEDRLIHALEQLKNRNKERAKQQKLDKQEEEKAKNEQREAAKKEKEEKEALEKAEKKEEERKKKDQEMELRIKRREKQAQQSLDLKAKAVDAERLRAELAVQQVAVNNALLLALGTWTESMQNKPPKKKQKTGREEKSERDKENVESEDEQQTAGHLLRVVGLSCTMLHCILHAKHTHKVV